VVASHDLIGTFRKGYRYFNTFGGNPVSCAAAMAVLKELNEADLVANARKVGTYARQQLETLKAKHEIIGDIRGSGLIFGAELVLDQATKEPASDVTDWVINEMRRRGIIHSKLGPHKNTLKIRPPMPFSMQNADQLFSALDDVLGLAATQL
jgi:4-aminobutyrate aminotransferase-like enzyme